MANYINTNNEEVTNHRHQWNQCWIPSFELAPGGNVICLKSHNSFTNILLSQSYSRFWWNCSPRAPTGKSFLTYSVLWWWLCSCCVLFLLRRLSWFLVICTLHWDPVKVFWAFYHSQIWKLHAGQFYLYPSCFSIQDMPVNHGSFTRFPNLKLLIKEGYSQVNNKPKTKE